MNRTLFDDLPVPRTGAHPESPQYFAWWRGFREGRLDSAASRCYDADPVIHGYYVDGHRVGRLFRPLPCMKERTR